MFHSKKQRDCKDSLTLFLKVLNPLKKRIQSFKDSLALSVRSYSGKIQPSLKMQLSGKIQSYLKIQPHLQIQPSGQMQPSGKIQPQLKRPQLKNLQSSKGSLVLSLVASGAVAAAIVATHQLTQRFSSGAVGAFNQQQAYTLAQKSLALAGLMVSRNVVLCSNVRVGNRVVGCKKGPLPNDKLAKDFYDRLKITSAISFTEEPALPNDYAETFLQLKHKTPQSSHDFVFKHAEITWALKSLRDGSLRSISGAFKKGYVCRKKSTFEVTDGTCSERPLVDALPRWPSKSHIEKQSKQVLTSSRESNLIEEVHCITTDTNGDGKIDSADTSDTSTVCDYYVDADRDDGVVFISAKVPYKMVDSEGTEGTKHLVMNAAVRRPSAIVKFHLDENSASVCDMRCGGAISHPDMASAGASESKPLCYGWRSTAVGRHLAPDHSSFTSKIKIKNYGPGVLYNLNFKVEDISPHEGGLVKSKILRLFTNPSEARNHLNFLEPFHSESNWPASKNKGTKIISEGKVCYGRYPTRIARVTCDAPSGSSDCYNTAQGIICKENASVCGNGTGIFADNVGALKGAEARNSLSGCIREPVKKRKMSYLANSFLTSPYERHCVKDGNCKFNRIDSSGDSETETWCFNEYEGTAATNPTGRVRAAITP